MEGCTFKPRINPTSKNRSIERVDPIYDILFKLANKSKNKDKSTDEIEWEKGREECTFRPNVSKI
jgi:hypothetical protein